MHVYFRQFWTDPRLSFEKRPGLEKLFVGAEYINTIWTPDTFFVNEKTAFFHNATTENQFLRILNTGEILRSIRWVNDKTRINTRGEIHYWYGYKNYINFVMLTTNRNRYRLHHRKTKNLKHWKGFSQLD